MCNEGDGLKAMLLYGSPRVNGNTGQILRLIKEILTSCQINCKEIFLAKTEGSMCSGCDWCADHKHCIYTDDFSQIMGTIPDYQLIVIASPVYFGGVTAQLKRFVDRMQVLYQHRERNTAKPVILCVSTAAEARTDVFDGIKRTMKYVSYSLGAVHTAYILVNQAEEIRDIDTLVERETVKQTIHDILRYLQEK